MEALSSIGFSRWRNVLNVAVLVVLAYAVLRPLLAFGHELAVAAIAWLLHLAVGTGAWEPVIRFLGLDPIYAGAAIRAAGGVQVAGFAVAGPIGLALHAVLPRIFLGGDRVAAGAAVSMVAAPGAPAIGRGLAGFGADVACLAVGLWLFWRWRGLNWRVAICGLFVQAQIAVNHLLEARVAMADLDASGLPFAVQVAAPDGGWFTDRLNSMPTDERALLTGGALLLLGYGCAVLLVFVAGLLRKRPRLAMLAQGPRLEWPGAMKWSTASVGVLVAFAAASSPIGALAIGNSNWQLSTSVTALGMRGVVRPSGRRHALRLAGATPVSIAQQTDGSWQYVVDGTAEIIRGVGYNPQYAALNKSDRISLYNRDFGDMRRLGFNTIEGWFEGQFDSVTLDAAAQNGIGVLMPFELNQDWDVTDPAVRQGILERISAYVEKYRDHPAVRMWSPGNENMHRVLYAHWVSQANVPAARAKAEAYAAFLPQVVDRIHELDPNHPVVYRDAEDVYLSWITNAFAQAGGDRPWLVYGANVYSAARLHEIIANWPKQWPGRPLLISEFAPGGVGPDQRPFGFQQQWNEIRSRSDVVLGGLAYTWATNGPEDLDRVFGLVDANGVPTDGALAALSAVYMADGGSTNAAAPTDQSN